jgi:DNA repair exonuclease SbcCD ATPase subunit
MDLKETNERTKKAYDELIEQINNKKNEINKIKEEINTFDEKIQEKNNKIEKLNTTEMPKIEEINYKIKQLQNNVSIIEDEKFKENMNYENKKYGLMENIQKVKAEIEELEEQLNSKLNNMTCGNVNLYLKYDNNKKNFNPDKDIFYPTSFGYELKEFEFMPEIETMSIKDTKTNIIEKKIKYDLIKRVRLDADSVKLVNEIETKYYKDEREKRRDSNRKKPIKLFITLRRNNLDLVATEYNDYKKFVDIINTIIIHK